MSLVLENSMNPNFRGLLVERIQQLLLNRLREPHSSAFFSFGFYVPVEVLDQILRTRSSHIRRSPLIISPQRNTNRYLWQRQKYVVKEREHLSEERT